MYDQLIVDPKTDKLYPGEKPWLLYFYKADCAYCHQFKSEFEAMAPELSDLVNMAYMDGIKNEYIKETFGLREYPELILLQNDTVLRYTGMKVAWRIKTFINGEHFTETKPYPIPARINAFTL